MSVNLVFAQNLRLLCETRPSIAQTARDLDLSKVQMNRFLNGTSHPKPAVLARICAYFGLDARILLQPLDPGSVPLNTAANNLGKRHERFSASLNDNVLSGLEFTMGNAPYAADADFLPTGLYHIWRRSAADSSKFVRFPILVTTHGNTLVGRGYDTRHLAKQGYTKSRPAAEREFRGMFFPCPGGFTFLTVHRDPNFLATTGYFEPVADAAHTYFGVILLGRPDRPGMSRISSILLQLLTGTEANPVRVAHAQVFFDEDDLPRHIRRAMNLTVFR